MKELTAVNPYTFDGTEKRGMCPFETAKKIRKLWADNSKKIEEEFGCPEYPERVVSSIPFEEQPFGSLDDEPAECDDNDTPRPTIVSLALFDQDEMLSACTGIALPDRTSSIHLTRILTSARLVTVFNEKRNRDDKLRIEVRVPHHHPFNGFVELYDDNIAIVTSLTLPNIFPVDLDLQETSLPVGTEVLATGRAFKSFDLMVANGRLIDDPSGDHHKHRVSDCPIIEAGLGGPLTDSDRNFVALNINCAVGKTWFLPRKLIRERLEQFQILMCVLYALGIYELYLPQLAHLYLFRTFSPVLLPRCKLKALGVVTEYSVILITVWFSFSKKKITVWFLLSTPGWTLVFFFQTPPNGAVFHYREITEHHVFDT